VCAALQYNDPDPAVWIAIYAAAAAACVGALRARRQWWFAGAVGFVAGAWAVTLLIRTLRQRSVANPFASMTVADDPVELTREILGLTGILLWMAALVWQARLAARHSEGSTEA
jgi:hypothetical protein